MSMPLQFDLVIISAEDLKTTTQSRVIVSIIHKDHNNNSLFEQPTHMVTHGVFTNPEWNSAMCCTIDGFAAFQGLLTLVAKVKTGNEVVDNGLIGEVRVNIKDSLEVLGENHLTYVVRKPSGEAMGVLNFSCKFKELMTYPVGQAAPPCYFSHAALASAPPEERYYMSPQAYVWNQGYAPPPPTPYPAQQTNICCSLAQQLGIAIVVELLKMAVFGDLSL